MESSQEFHNVKIPTNKPLTWKLIPNQGQAWHLVDEDRLLAKIVIQDMLTKTTGSFLGHEFFIDRIPPRKPWKWSTRKEFKTEYSIKLKEISDSQINSEMVDWGILEHGYGRYSPYRLILVDGRIYSLEYHDSKPVPTIGLGFELLLKSSNPDDAGRIIGITKFNKNLLLIPVLIGLTERKTSTFSIKQYQSEDPPLTLMASISYCIAIKWWWESQTGA